VELPAELPNRLDIVADKTRVNVVKRMFPNLKKLKP
jgi:O-phosphoseryl-tRNA(Cys) synthetase